MEVADPRGMRPYPVDVIVESPARFERVQVALRFALAVVLGFVGFTAGWVGFLLYLVLPVIAAIAISSSGPEAYVSEAGPRLWRAVSWVIAFSAYMLLLTDRFPVGADATCRVGLRTTGTPTVGGALARLVTSIPTAIVLGLLMLVSCVLTTVGVVTILVAETVPAGILRYQHAVVRGQARLFAYQAALVAEYPPFGLDAAGGSAQPGSPTAHHA